MHRTLPWQIDKVRSSWRHLLFPLRTGDHKAIVIFERGNCLGLLGAKTALNRVDYILGRYRFHLIPLGRRTLSFKEPLPAKEKEVTFTIHLNLSYQVIDAITIAQDDPADLDNDVIERIRGLAHHCDGKYAADKWQELHQELEQTLEQAHLGLGIEVDHWAVWVSRER